jgi:SPP1 family predicted phage head-tail adaptor
MNCCAERHLEVNPPLFGCKDHLIHLPRSDKTQSLGEQRFNHGEPVERRKAAIVLHAECGRLPPSARRKRKRGGGDVKGSATPGLRPPLTSPPPQNHKATARSTRNDIDPKRITLQQQSPSVDSYGQQVSTWTDVATVWASVEPSVGRELMAAQAVSLDQPTTITIRWQPLFASPKAVAAMRAVYNGRIFNIHSVENESERNTMLTLIASEGLNDG